MDEIQFKSFVNEEQSLPKKARKHKHKKSRDKSKKEKLYHTLTDDGAIIDEELQDCSATAEEILDMEGAANDKLEMGGKLEVDKKSKKSKKKEKNKDRSKKDRKKNNDGESKENGDNDDETDSEEERWLHAIEAGKLEEVDDELKRMRNPRLLTARQRALLEKQKPLDATEEGGQMSGSEACEESPLIPPEPLLSLPSGVKEKVLTQEMLEKKAIKSQKRRAQALEKREEDKKKTVDRLLKKQDSKVTKSSAAKKASKTEVPMVSYRDSREGVFLTLPQGFDYPIQPQIAKRPPPRQLCGVKGCKNAKKYSCRSSGIPLCSLKCYKTVLETK